MDINPLLTDVIMPLAVTILAGVASAILTLAYSWFAKKTGIIIESKDREALHSAIVSGINLGVAKTGQILGPAPRIQVDNPLTRIALEYVLRSVPDAIRRFNLTDARIEQMILSKIPQVAGQTSPVPPATSGN